MPTMSPHGTHERTHVRQPGCARQIWLRGPRSCVNASFGSSFSCVPQPISAGAMPSSWKPSTDHVFTNSSSRFGSFEICVSRSEMWIVFTPSACASLFHAWSSRACSDRLAVAGAFVEARVARCPRAPPS